MGACSGNLGSEREERPPMQRGLESGQGRKRPREEGSTSANHTQGNLLRGCCTRCETAPSSVLKTPKTFLHLFFCMSLQHLFVADVCPPMLSLAEQGCSVCV